MVLRRLTDDPWIIWYIYGFQRQVIHLPGHMIRLRCRRNPEVLYRLLMRTRTLARARQLTARLSVKLTSDRYHETDLACTRPSMIERLAETIESKSVARHRLTLRVGQHEINVLLQPCHVYPQVHDEQHWTDYIDIAGLIRGESEQTTAALNGIIIRVCPNDTQGLTIEILDHLSNETYRNFRYTVACVAEVPFAVSQGRLV